MNKILKICLTLTGCLLILLILMYFGFLGYLSLFKIQVASIGTMLIFILVYFRNKITTEVTIVVIILILFIMLGSILSLFGYSRLVAPSDYCNSISYNVNLHDENNENLKLVIENNGITDIDGFEIHEYLRNGKVKNIRKGDSILAETTKSYSVEKSESNNIIGLLPLYYSSIFDKYLLCEGNQWYKEIRYE